MKATNNGSILFICSFLQFNDMILYTNYKPKTLKEDIEPQIQPFELELYDLIKGNKDNKIKRTIMSKYNIDLVRRIGSGSEGVAYLTSDNKVLKITGSETATYTAHHMIGKNYKHLVNVYKIYKLPMYDDTQEPYYGILQEYVQVNPSKMEFFNTFNPYIGKIMSFLTNNKQYETNVIFNIRNMDTSQRHILLDKVYTYIVKDQKIDQNTKQLYLDTLIQISEMADEMDTIPDVDEDFNLGNIGYKSNGELCMLDLGSVAYNPPLNIHYENKQY